MDQLVADVISSYLLDAFPVRVSFEKPPKVAIRLSELVSGTSSKVLEKSSKCSAKLTRADQKNTRWSFNVNCGKDSHVVKVKAGKGRSLKVDKRDVFVSCSCEFWRFYGPDFHAKARGYLDGSPLSDGSAPNVRDPNGQNLICKHVAAVSRVVSNYAIK